MANQDSASHSSRGHSPPPPPEDGRWQKVPKFLRAIGLQIVAASSFARATTEPTKVAIERNRTAAAIRSLVHVVPFVGAVALLTLNFNGLMVQHARWYAILQYIAKAHEILMQASITAVFMMYLRRLLVLDHPTPFGALVSGLSITKIGYLWSPEFVATWSFHWSTHGKKATFIMAVVVTVFLAAAVGPSSAVLMVPRPVEVPLSTHRTTVDPSVLFPSVVNESAERLTNQRFISSFIQGGTLSYDVGYNEWALNWSNDVYTYNATNDYSTLSYTYVSYAHVATPMRIFADIFEQAINGRNFTEYASTGIPYGTMQSQMPSVATMCTSGQRIESNSSETETVDQLFMAENSLFYNGFLTDRKLFNLIETDETWPMLWLPTSAMSGLYDGRGEGYSAFAVFVSNDTFNEQPNAGYTPFSCMIKASWQQADVNATFSGKWPLRASFKAHPTPADIPGNINDLEDRINPFFWKESPINLTTEWLRSLKVKDNLTDATFDFNTMATYLKAETAAQSELAGQNEASYSKLYAYTQVLSMTVSSLIANALSTTHCQQECPKLALSNASIPAANSPVTTNVQLHVAGIGYTFRNWPSGIAIGILLLYCLVVIGTVTYSFITGVSSSAWDSAAEITALALGSAPPGDLGHISAGLETLDVFRRPVAIMTKHDHLELVFGDGEKADFDNLQEDTRY